MESRPMKESGIEWIGEIPKEWNIAPISRLFFIKAGGDAKPEFYSDNSDKNHPYPVYTNTHIENKVYAYTSNPLFPEKSITVSGRGAIGKAFYRNTPFDAIIRLIVLVAKFNLDSRYFAYFISVVIPFNTGSSAIGQLSTLQIAPYKLAVPPVEEQQKIASFLDEKVVHIDNILEDTKKSIEYLKAYKQSLITETVTKGLNANVEMKNSGIEWIGEIPKHWESLRIKYASYLKGRIGWQGLTSEEYQDEGPYLITGKDLINGKVNWSTCTHITKERFDEAPDIHIENQDLLITKDGTIGKLALVSEFDDKASLNSGVLLIRKTKDCYNEKFLYYILISDVFWRWFNLIKSPNSTILHLYQNDFKDFSYPLPHISEQQQIADYLDEKTAHLDSLLRNKEKMLEELKAYKKSLIYEYVTGKKEVQ